MNLILELVYCFGVIVFVGFILRTFLRLRKGGGLNPDASKTPKWDKDMVWDYSSWGESTPTFIRKSKVFDED